MERGYRPENLSAIDRLPKQTSDKRLPRPDQIGTELRETKETPPLLRKSGLENYRYSRELDKSEPIVTLVDFVEVTITNPAKRKKLQNAIKNRDLAVIKNIFLEISKRKPDIADVVSKINNVILGDNPPWEYLDYFFGDEDAMPNFRTP
ncbi:MAG: hypothetical protein A2537_02850 [Candidatus Magasanikbacteria bacterium RIFOXYD2_FULL_36_9]|uniref:Uncharacterized protein n=1 Tax=Candidatus Magasanikbacteria bacterium RIFOXYD2_FULL_36_9 TaxID=1798707 RepID=A0A1F6NZF2_9BACT|nr:MAG: hypothetical protein A2537_02850 [Candidatus Magasanikbacteria bacterium RIFOXYD2_FULL_36_9]